MHSRLNIGSGKDYLEGWVNADSRVACNPDDVVILGTGMLPYPDDSFDEVRAFNVLTQIAEPEAFKVAMNELWRVTRGIIHIRVPNAAHISAYQDPMDVRRFTDQTFTYMEFGHRRYEQYGRHYGFRSFKVRQDLNLNETQLHFHLTPVKL